jgi:hypothetical protein
MKKGRQKVIRNQPKSMPWAPLGWIFVIFVVCDEYYLVSLSNWPKLALLSDRFGIHSGNFVKKM